MAGREVAAIQKAGGSVIRVVMFVLASDAREARGAAVVIVAICCKAPPAVTAGSRAASGNGVVSPLLPALQRRLPATGSSRYFALKIATAWAVSKERRGLFARSCSVTLPSRCLHGSTRYSRMVVSRAQAAEVALGVG